MSTNDIITGPQNCWEFWECLPEVRDECPAFTTNSGKDCYNFAEEFCPKIKVEFKHCWECPWYKRIKAEKDSQ